jgi:oxygen-independent coproporphyrinogen-3 oxidase
VHSIFIGGGTPSLFSPQAIDRPLADIRARLRSDPDCEINPKFQTPVPLKRPVPRFRWAAGVTLLSIGVSFDDEFLSVLANRVHDRARDCRRRSSSRHVRDLQPDIMYALPARPWRKRRRICVWR